jgi:hypothetical protein
MSTLDDYLADQFHTDRQELKHLEETISKTCQTLVDTFATDTAWPYSLTKGTTKPPERLSHSTTAMVLLSLQKALGEWKPPNAGATSFATPPEFFGEGSASKDLRSKTKQCVDTAASTLINGTSVGGKIETTSATYGSNDPLTLYFVTALSSQTNTEKTDWEEHRKFVLGRLEALQDTAPRPENFIKYFDFTKEAVKSDPIQNAFVPLRLVQSMLLAGKGNAIPSGFREYFETTLHDQLSFSSIPDSRFDPAELAFCLEGLLISQRHVIDRALLDRVMEVLSAAQQKSAFWRPTKPFLATDRGMTLFPISVEVANSILRSCEMFDGRDTRNTVASANIDLFRRYWQWLNARKVTFETRLGDQQVSVLGWDSEHVNKVDVVHVWETSQILEFLIAYHRLLRAHIARTSLTLARFNVRQPIKSSDSWDEITESCEPVVSLGEHYQVYKRIGESFVKPRQSGTGPKSFSMLLYGPPGTGKTTVAEKVADALSFPLITITVSDFLAGGGGNVEARAKAIFDVLMSQSNCVVLFDEIDAFLLDRDTDRYTKQETLFQFMTPGMLTKLNDLRKAERLIFIIATNYQNRIDSAIKRTGRIDYQYLLLPYDKCGRERIISALSGSTIDEDITALGRASLFLGYPDLRNTIQKSFGSVDIPSLCKELAALDRTTRLATFTTRLPDAKGPGKEELNKWPLEEFICLLTLALEDAPHTAHLIDSAACRAFFNVRRTESGSLKEILDRHSKQSPGGVPTAVVDYLEKLAPHPEKLAPRPRKK